MNEVAGIYKNTAGQIILVLGEATNTVTGNKHVIHKDMLVEDMSLFLSDKDEFLLDLTKITEDELMEIVANMPDHPCQCGGECECGGSCS